MNEGSVVDEVRARLAELRRSKIAYAEVEQERPLAAAYRIDLGDLDGIAERHRNRGYQEGQLDGFRSGFDIGNSRGRQQQRAADREVLRAVTAVLESRLDRIPARLAAPAEGKERRTKDELREEALNLLTEIRAAFAVLLAAIVSGEFDEPEAG